MPSKEQQSVGPSLRATAASHSAVASVASLDYIVSLLGLFYLDTDKVILLRDALVVAVIFGFEGGAIIRGVEETGIIEIMRKGLIYTRHLMLLIPKV